VSAGLPRIRFLGTPGRAARSLREADRRRPSGLPGA